MDYIDDSIEIYTLPDLEVLGSSATTYSNTNSGSDPDQGGTTIINTIRPPRT